MNSVYSSGPCYTSNYEQLSIPRGNCNRTPIPLQVKVGPKTDEDKCTFYVTNGGSLVNDPNVSNLKDPKYNNYLMSFGDASVFIPRGVIFNKGDIAHTVTTLIPATDPYRKYKITVITRSDLSTTTVGFYDASVTMTLATVPTDNYNLTSKVSDHSIVNIARTNVDFTTMTVMPGAPMQSVKIEFVLNNTTISNSKYYVLVEDMGLI